jgi:hypothetical protein
MLFLGTPHRGSDLAETFNNILRSIPGFSPKIYVSELEKGSESLQDINEQFRTVCTNVELVSLYETRRTSLLLNIRKLVQSKAFTIIAFIRLPYPSWSTKSLQYLDIQQSNLVDSMLTIMA